MFKKTAATKPPALKPYSDLPIGEFLGEPTHEVRVNREYYLGSAGGPGVNDSGVVQPELLIRAHR